MRADSLMLRVLHIVPGKLFGGVESTLVTWSRFRDLCPTLSFDVAVSWDGRLSRELRNLRTAVHVLGEVRVRYPVSIWRARRRLRDLLRREHFDVVLCHMPWTLAIFGPVVTSQRIGLAFGMEGKVNRFHWTARWAARTRPELAICVSRFLVDEVAQMFPDVPSEVVYNPVAPVRVLSRWERGAIRIEANTPQDAIVVAQACRLEQGKGHRPCLEALGLLRELPGWICWQIGGPQNQAEVRYFESLQQQAARLGIAERVRFWGQRTDVPRLLSAADVFCQPNDTFFEGMGNSFVEAMRCGLPVVTSCIGGAGEVVAEDCGVLLAPGDIAGLTAALKRLITDQESRAELGAVGRLRAESHFSPRTQIPRMYEVLSRATGCDRAASRTPSVGYHYRERRA
jgi:glycosyltransferase involved in cell wall biosynthesis